MKTVMKNSTKKIALLGVMASVALVLSYLEALLPPVWAAVPGIKMGLPNIIMVFLLYRFGVKECAVVSFIRIFIVSLLFGSVMTMAYSLAGAFLSVTLMAICKKTNLFSVVGTSIVGGVAHNAGQIIVAIFLFNTVQIGYYMAVLAVTGTVAGVAIGIIGAILLKKTEKIKI